ncbi:hypothetical protein OAP45_00080 [Candidatus Pelagibacter sp.]|nr:hypothetical protein [Candidatus Pelagibacter sp.]
MTVLIKNKIVKKYFASKDSHLFLNEIYWLNKLSKYKFFPKILKVDYQKKIISTSYEGDIISSKNKPNNWSEQLKEILNILKKNNCFHSDIKPDNLLVKKNKLVLIDFAQSIKITDLNKNLFFKKRIFYDQYSFNRVKLSIENNLILSNDLRVLVVWDQKNNSIVEKKILQNKKFLIIDKIKLRKDFHTEIFRDRIFCIDQFYNKNISKNNNKLKNDIYVYIIKSINPIFKSNKMIFSREERIVDDEIFAFKKKIRKKRLGIIHISDNFEESKRNAIFFSKSINNFPALYFFKTQNIFNSEKDFFQKLNKEKKIKYVILRNKNSQNDDIDILVNNYFLFKRFADCHSYKLKNLKFISNSGDPVEDNGFKVSNYFMIKNKKIKIDIRYIGDRYFDIRWQKDILANRKISLYYYIPDDKNFVYSLIYHIVYHKSFLDKKYINILKKKLKLRSLNLIVLKKLIDNFLSLKKYKIHRPLDLTIPITYELDSFALIKEIKLIENQIHQRNYSGANKMLYNIFKFQKIFPNLFIRLFYLLFLCQFNLFKMKLKNFIFKYYSRDK